MRILAFALLMAATASAAFAQPASAQPGRAGFDQPSSPPRGAIVAGLNETVRVGGIMVRPLAVVQDSRCPRDAMCVWAGRLTLRTMVGRQTVTLTLGQPHVLPGGRQITLVHAAPDRWSQPRPNIDRTPRFAFRSGR